MSCRARDRPWEPRAWGGESPRPAWLHGPRVGSTGGGGQPRGRRTLTGVHRKELVRVVTAAASPTTCLPSAMGAGRAGGRGDMEN